MAARGTTQTLTVTYRSVPSGPVVDPTSVALSIYKDGTLILGPITSDVQRDGVGLYRYEWAIDPAALVGYYTAAWSGVLPGNAEPTIGYESVYVSDQEVPSVPGFGGCPWPMDPGCMTDAWDALDDDVQARALALASATLQRLTGNRVGVCPIKVRPCKRAARGYAHAMPYFYGGPQWIYPQNWGGAWVNSCGCGGACSCSTVCEVALPAPVGRVDEVKVSGVVLDPTTYRIDNGHILVWTGTGDCPWPAWQDLSASDSEDGTFSVTYLNAYPVDANGAYAVGILALEYGLACSDQNCRLPDGVTQIVRQGITMSIPAGAFPDGMTQIREVDSYIALWNPKGLQRQATVWSPDMPRPRIVTQEST